MVIVLKPKCNPESIEILSQEIRKMGVRVEKVVGSDYTILGLLGDTSGINTERIAIHPIVHRIMQVEEPYKRANKLFHPEPTRVHIGDRIIGGDQVALIAGPCSVESEEQIVSLARAVKKMGAGFLRGGAFKPRSSPYSFQGLGFKGLELLKTARAETGLPIVSEILSEDMVERFNEDVDIIQVGTRNMQNFMLLRELGRANKPVLLKRGIAATLEEWLMSAEYILAEGNPNVILCERGIRTFERYTRNTLDLSAIPSIKHMSHLPVIVDPSHATGIAWMVAPMARAAVAAGADGVMIEVHDNPDKALSDGQQAMKTQELERLIGDLQTIAAILGRSM